MPQQNYGEWMRSNPPIPNLTAVDYLVNLYYTQYNVLLPSEDYAQAKQMEKEQIMNARLDGFKESAEGWNGEYPGWDVKETSIKINNEQYYNETYNK